MKYKDLKEGYRIEYKFIQEEQLKYAQSPVMTLKECEAKMNELKEDNSVQSFIVLNVKFYESI